MWLSPQKDYIMHLLEHERSSTLETYEFKPNNCVNSSQLDKLNKNFKVKRPYHFYISKITSQFLPISIFDQLLSSKENRK